MAKIELRSSSLEALSAYFPMIFPYLSTSDFNGLQLLCRYFDNSEKRCMPFYYGGCEGNGNRFDTLEDCQKSCPSEFLQVWAYFYFVSLRVCDEYALLSFFANVPIASFRTCLALKRKARIELRFIWICIQYLHLCYMRDDSYWFQTILAGSKSFIS